MKGLVLAAGVLLVAGVARAQSAVGLTVYEKNCKMCHGADGTPSAAMAKMMPSLPKLNAKFMAGISEESIVKVLTNGSATGKMKSFKGKLTPEEMAAVAKYVKEMAKVKTG
jgi:mono/diheme cytochrome c family protein